MAALQIGKMEASAAINLHKSIPGVIYQQLAELCKTPAALLDSHMFPEIVKGQSRSLTHLPNGS